MRKPNQNQPSNQQLLGALLRKKKENARETPDSEVTSGDKNRFVLFI